MFNVAAFRLVLMAVAGWLASRERDGIAYLVEENRARWRPLASRRFGCAMRTGGGWRRKRIVSDAEARGARI